MSDKKKKENVTHVESLKTSVNNIADTINTIRKEINYLEAMPSGLIYGTFTVNALDVILTGVAHLLNTASNLKLNSALEYYKKLENSITPTKSGQGKKSKKS